MVTKRMKKTLLTLGILMMFLFVGLSAGATTPASTETTKTVKIGLSQPAPARLPGPIIKAIIDIGMFHFKASGKGDYGGPLGHLEYVNINYHFTSEDAQTITYSFWFMPTRIPLAPPRTGEHSAGIIWVHGEASQDRDGTYHIEGKFWSGTWTS
jgi:hypothetical protein